METGAGERKSRHDRLDELVFGLVDAQAPSRETNRDTWEFRPRFLDEYLLLFMAGGQGRMTVDGRFAELRGGGLYLRRPGELVGAAAWNLEDRGLYVIRFRAGVLEWNDAAEGGGSVRTEESGEEPLLPVIPEQMMRAPLSAERLCESLVRSWQDADALERFGSRIHLQELIRTVLSERREVQEDDDESRLEQVRAYMQQHHARKLSLDELAGVAQLSMRHFMRLFKQRYGSSAMEDLAVYRIAQAQNLMRAEDSPRIRDIAHHVGFRDEAYFRRKFKQIAGVPPAAFIRNAKQKIAAYHPQAIGILLALHVVPCAAPADHPWTDYYRRKYATDNVLPLSGDSERRLEQLRTHSPDYILASDKEMDAGEKEQLSAIATLGEIRGETDWRTRLRLAASDLERAGAAEAWLERYERKADFVRQQIAERLGGVRLLILKLEGARLVLPGRYSIASVFYDDLRIEAPPELCRAQEDQEIEPNELADWRIDRMLMIVGPDEKSRIGWRSLAQTAEWTRIASVRADRVELFPANLLSEYNAFTHDLILDEALNIWRDCT